MLVSIHMPKTAGQSFRRSLEEHFGERFRHDYGDYPLAHSADSRRHQAQKWGLAAQPAQFADVDCVHGHFMPAKYLHLAEQLPCTFVTWLREPMSRLVSHYHYWLRSYDAESELTSSLHRRVVEEGWTLEQFCLAPELRNVYTEFLWGFPLERLNFVGITEFFAEDLRYFSTEYLGNRLHPRTLNRRARSDDVAIAAELATLDRDRIAAFHADDMALYDQALGWRQHRMDRLA